MTVNLTSLIFMALIVSIYFAFSLEASSNIMSPLLMRVILTFSGIIFLRVASNFSLVPFGNDCKSIIYFFAFLPPTSITISVFSLTFLTYSFFSIGLISFFSRGLNSFFGLGASEANKVVGTYFIFYTAWISCGTSLMLITALRVIVFSYLTWAGR